MRRFAIASILFIICIHMNVIAAEIQNFRVDVNSGLKEVVISGAHSGGVGRLVTVSVAREGDTQNIYYQMEQISGTDGAFKFRYVMDPVADASDVYTVRVSGSNVSPLTMNYKHFNDVDADTLNTLINNGGDVKSQINAYKKYLNIDLSDGSAFSLIQDKDKVYNALANRNISNVLQLENYFNQAVAIQSLNEGIPKNLEEIINIYAPILGLDVGAGSYYRFVHKSESKIQIYNAIITKDFSVKDAGMVSDKFKMSAAFACVNGVDNTNRDKFSEIINKLKSDGYITLSLNDYNANLDINTVNYSILEKQPYASFADIENAIKNALNALENSGGNNTPSYNGGSSSGSKLSVDANFVKSDTNIAKEVFVDIDGVDWAKEAIISLNQKGIIHGSSDREFEPNRNVTRAEFVKMLVLSFDLLEPDSEASFRDVNEKSWSYKFIASAKKHEIISGISDVDFGPDEELTREQMAALVYRTVKYLGLGLQENRPDNVFIDNMDISQFAYEAVTHLVKSSIINGMGNNSFEPRAYCTRAMASKVLFEVLKVADR